MGVNLFPRLRCLSLLKQRLTLNQLKQVHQHLVIHDFNHPSKESLIGHLIAAYSSLDIHHARLVFNSTDNPNVFIYNVMIRCMAADEGIQLFANACTVRDLTFDEYSYVYALGACARSTLHLGLLAGKQIHCRVVKTGFVDNEVVQTTCIHFYTSHGVCGSGRKVFDEMHVKTSVTWGAMISGYCSQKKKGGYFARQGLLLFLELLRDGNEVRATDTTMVSVITGFSRVGDLMSGVCVHGYIEKMILLPLENVYIGTCLVDMYSRCGCVSSALDVFRRMKMRNIQTWTSMMTGLALHGRGVDALEILHEMQARGVAPNAITFTSLLCACCHAGLVEGLVLFNSMSSAFAVIPSIQHYGCVVDLLGRRGRLQEAYEFKWRTNLVK